MTRHMTKADIAAVKTKTEPLERRSTTHLPGPRRIEVELPDCKEKLVVTIRCGKSRLPRKIKVDGHPVKITSGPHKGEYKTENINVDTLFLSIKRPSSPAAVARACCKPPDTWNTAVARFLALQRIFAEPVLRNLSNTDRRTLREPAGHDEDRPCRHPADGRQGAHKPPTHLHAQLTVRVGLQPLQQVQALRTRQFVPECLEAVGEAVGTGQSDEVRGQHRCLLGSEVAGQAHDPLLQSGHDDLHLEKDSKDF